MENDKNRWPSWDKERLEREYSPSQWSQRGSGEWVFKNHVEVVTNASDEIKATVPCELDIEYGERNGEKYDLFGAQFVLPKDAPVFVYIHGGYWQAMSREISSYCVKPLHKAGFFVAVLGYDIAPKVEFKDIVEEIQKGASAILKWAAERGSRSVVFGGHSAGAHLAAMLMHDSEWCQKEPNFNLVTGFVHISGVFDLVPLVYTSMNNPLKLGRETAQHFSPQYLFTTLPMDKLSKIKQVVVVGEHDPPEFRRQSGDYAQGLIRTGFTDVHFRILEGFDHFSIVEKLQEDDHIVTKIILKLLNGTSTQDD